MAKKQTLCKLLAGLAGVSLAIASRGVYPQEVAELLGGYEAKAAAEHFCTAFSVPFLTSFMSDITKGGLRDLFYNYSFGYFVFQPFVWEGCQALTRGYVQWEQIVADILGIGIGFTIANYNPIKNFVKKSKNKCIENYV